MDFKIVLEKLVSAFDKMDVRYALMGGLALGVWGVPRATVDIDFLIRRDDLGKVDRIMHDLGYECRHRSENVSQYISPLNLFGEVDFLHAFRSASIEMLQRAAEKEVHGGSLRIKVLRPEDIVGLKLQAIKNNPSREYSDTADIRQLLAVSPENVDWNLIKTYCGLLGLDEMYDEIRGGLGK